MFGVGESSFFEKRTKKERRDAKFIRSVGNIDVRLKTPCPVPGEASANHKKKQEQLLLQQREGKKLISPRVSSTMKKRKQEHIDDSDEDALKTDSYLLPPRDNETPSKGDTQESGQWQDGGNICSQTSSERRLGSKKGEK